VTLAVKLFILRQQLRLCRILPIKIDTCGQIEEEKRQSLC